MGIEPDIEYGLDCLRCFDAGKTPKFIYASFAGIVKCPGEMAGPVTPPNGIWKMTQILACQWLYNGAIYQVLYNLMLPNPGIAILSGARIWFKYDQVGGCPDVFSNQLACFPGVWIGFGGFGIVAFV